MGGGGYQTDLLNLQLDSPGEPVGGSPPKRTRQAESSPGGLSDSTGLEENVTMEAIARTLQHAYRGDTEGHVTSQLEGGRYRENPRGQARGRSGDVTRFGGSPEKTGRKARDRRRRDADLGQPHRRPRVPPCNRSKLEEGEGLGGRTCLKTTRGTGNQPSS